MNPPLSPFTNLPTLKSPALAVITDTSFYIPFLLSSLLQLTVYHICVSRFPSTFKTDRQKSWILTTLSSFVMTIGSLPFLLRFAIKDLHLGYFDWLHTYGSVGLSAFFITYLLFDLLIGSVEYKAQIHPMSGWFHHTLYTFVVFHLIQWQVSGTFCILAVLELPTLLLAIGTIRKELRRDRVFGAVFFATRIVFHVYMIKKIHEGFPGRHFYLIPIGVFPLHVLWFQGWVKQQVRIRAKNKSEEVVVVSDMAAEVKPISNQIATETQIEEGEGKIVMVKIWVKSREKKVKTWVLSKVRQRFPTYMPDYHRTDSIDQNSRFVAVSAS